MGPFKAGCASRCGHLVTDKPLPRRVLGYSVRPNLYAAQLHSFVIKSPKKQFKTVVHKQMGDIIMDLHLAYCCGTAINWDTLKNITPWCNWWSKKCHVFLHWNYLWTSSLILPLVIASCGRKKAVHHNMWHYCRLCNTPWKTRLGWLSIAIWTANIIKHSKHNIHQTRLLLHSKGAQWQATTNRQSFQRRAHCGRGGRKSQQ